MNTKTIFNIILLAIVTVAGILITRKLIIKSPTESKRSMSSTQLPSGLQYTVIKEGTGATPTKGQHVTVHYTGWLEENGKEGKKFDSSVDRGKPFTFIIGQGQVIKGWDEGVLSMKIGEKRRLVIPSNLGYGPHGFPGAIPGGATLIFDVELLSVK
jgi:peptidylprolyl isomerase